MPLRRTLQIQPFFCLEYGQLKEVELHTSKGTRTVQHRLYNCMGTRILKDVSMTAPITKKEVLVVTNGFVPLSTFTLKSTLRERRSTHARR